MDAMAWEFHGDKPIYTQLVERLQQRMITGEYPPGGRLPSVRDLAEEAAVNPNTMQRALAELEDQQLVFSQRTAGRFVTQDGERLTALGREMARQRLDLAPFDGVCIVIAGLQDVDGPEFIEGLVGIVDLADLDLFAEDVCGFLEDGCASDHERFAAFADGRIQHGSDDDLGTDACGITHGNGGDWTEDLFFCAHLISPFNMQSFSFGILFFEFTLRFRYVDYIIILVSFQAPNEDFLFRIKFPLFSKRFH